MNITEVNDVEGDGILFKGVNVIVRRTPDWQRDPAGEQTVWVRVYGESGVEPEEGPLDLFLRPRDTEDQTHGQLVTRLVRDGKAPVPVPQPPVAPVLLSPPDDGPPADFTGIEDEPTDEVTVQDGKVFIGDPVMNIDYTPDEARELAASLVKAADRIESIVVIEDAGALYSDGSRGISRLNHYLDEAGFEHDYNLRVKLDPERRAELDAIVSGAGGRLAD
jgi:hypothetical protein